MPLAISPQLSLAANRKAQDMIKNNYFDHQSPNGRTPWHFIIESGYNYYKAGENLAINFTTSEKLFEAWINSPDHRDNIINPEFEEVGFGITEGVIDNKQTKVVVQMFGAKKESAKLETEERIEGIDTKAIDINNSGDQNFYLPSPPVITSPKDDSYTNDKKIKVSGTASKNSDIYIFQNKEIVNQTTTDEQGKFSSEVYLNKDGRYTINATTTDNAKVSSNFSQDIGVTRDSQPPKILFSQSFFLPSNIRGEKGFDIFLRVSGDTKEVTASWGNLNAILKSSDDMCYLGTIRQKNSVFLPHSLLITAKDRAGNYESLRVIK